jgi:hypothetical protein
LIKPERVADGEGRLAYCQICRGADSDGLRQWSHAVELEDRKIITFGYSHGLRRHNIT